jgi:hypothetical protein
MNSGKMLLSGIFFSIALFSFFRSNGQDINIIKKPLTEKEIPVAPDKMADYLWQQIEKDQFTKAHFGWKLAFIQHPMYLLIDEDRGEPVVGERVPPWGAANAEDYAGRVRRNLNSLKELPGLKLNYEWSAFELQSITKKFPDISDEMKRQFQNGSLDFVNGSYSQAHLQVLGSESNWRQFEYGLEIYRDLFDKKVTVYATQETGIHQQLPQILGKFNYKYMYLPLSRISLNLLREISSFFILRGIIISLSPNMSL